MIVDAVISSNNWTFFDITAGGIGMLSGGNLSDDSNHRSLQNIGSGVNQGPKPAGSNVGYADGHAAWKKFDDMKHRYTRGQFFWW